MIGMSRSGVGLRRRGFPRRLRRQARSIRMRSGRGLLATRGPGDRLASALHSRGAPIVVTAVRLSRVRDDQDPLHLACCGDASGAKPSPRLMDYRVKRPLENRPIKAARLRPIRSDGTKPGRDFGPRCVHVRSANGRCGPGWGVGFAVLAGLALRRATTTARSSCERNCALDGGQPIARVDGRPTLVMLGHRCTCAAPASRAGGSAARARQRPRPR